MPSKPRPSTPRKRRYYSRKQAQIGSYTNPSWRRLRLRILGRDPICLRCHTSPSTVADHIIPRRQGGPDTESNLQGLCARCHTVVTNRYDGGFGNQTKQGKRGA